MPGTLRIPDDDRLAAAANSGDPCRDHAKELRIRVDSGRR
jgi:hypothetical protein